MRKLWLLTLGWTVSVLALADSERHDQIEVTPKLCIVNQRSPTCDLELKLAWTAREVDKHCVQVEGEDEKLVCWTSSREGQVEVQREIAETLKLQLEKGDAQTVIARAKVDVLEKDTGDRRRRRRTRYVWDVL